MTITTNERDLVEQAAKHRSAIAVARTALEVVDNERKEIRRTAELELRRVSKETLVKAQTDLDEKAQTLDAAKRHEQSLLARLDANDASVTVEDLKTAEKAVDRATRLHKAAQAALVEPKRQYAIDTSDNLIADRAVQILTANAGRLGLDGVDIISFKRANSYEPAARPALVVSQTSNTGNYGRAVLRGPVSLKFFTDDGSEAPMLDPALVAEVFDEHRCDVILNGNTLNFERCVYETPMLTNGPDVGTLLQWGSDMTGRLHAAINERASMAGVRAKVAYIVKQRGGYMEDVLGIEVVGARFEVEGGDAIGYVDIEVSLENGGGASIIANAAQSSKDYLLDVPTDMGLLKKVVASVEEAPLKRTFTGNYGLGGQPLYNTADPKWIVRYEVHTKFQPMVTAVVD